MLEKSSNLDLEIFTKTGKLRKRKKKKTREYFTKDTDDAIIEYLKSTNEKERNHIFDTRINEGIHKLAENIIHTFKFYYTELNNVEDLKHEVVVFLLDKWHLYKQEKGKAYSYLGTIAKRYLIVYNENNYKKLKLRADLQEVDEDKKVIIDMSVDSKNMELSDLVKSYIDYVEKNINSLFPSVSDQSIVLSILHLFKICDFLEVFNKQHFYFYIREMTGQNTTAITRCTKELKSIYKKVMKMDYLFGEIK